MVSRSNLFDNNYLDKIGQVYDYDLTLDSLDQEDVILTAKEGIVFTGKLLNTAAKKEAS